MENTTSDTGARRIPTKVPSTSENFPPTANPFDGPASPIEQHNHEVNFQNWHCLDAPHIEISDSRIVDLEQSFNLDLERLRKEDKHKDKTISPKIGDIFEQ